MNLYEIDYAIMQAYDDAVDPETGEIINDAALEALDGLQMEFDRKAEGILLWIKNLTAEAEALKKEKQAFEERQRRAERKAESLKQYIANALHGEKFATDRVAVWWRRSESVEFSGDVFSLPEDCLRFKDPEVNKAELKKRLKAGESYDGAKLVQNQNMIIK